MLRVRAPSPAIVKSQRKNLHASGKAESPVSMIYFCGSKSKLYCYFATFMAWSSDARPDHATGGLQKRREQGYGSFGILPHDRPGGPLFSIQLHRVRQIFLLFGPQLSGHFLPE